MKQHEFFISEDTGNVIIRWYGDPAREQVMERPYAGEALTSTQIASLLNRAYWIGIEHKQEEIRSVLGIRG